MPNNNRIAFRYLCGPCMGFAQRWQWLCYMLPTSWVCSEIPLWFTPDTSEKIPLFVCWDWPCTGENGCWGVEHGRWSRSGLHSQLLSARGIDIDLPQPIPKAQDLEAAVMSVDGRPWFRVKGLRPMLGIMVLSSIEPRADLHSTLFGWQGIALVPVQATQCCMLPHTILLTRWSFHQYAVTHRRHAIWTIQGGASGWDCGPTLSQQSKGGTGDFGWLQHYRRVRCLTCFVSEPYTYSRMAPPDVTTNHPVCCKSLWHEGWIRFPAFV